ncbi:hypothetical protein HYT24_03470 [Candidatus Pacearchaeota archaeon]|nr:hypothetical protein [Candidatus Pacearchaeota archaeon]
MKRDDLQLLNQLIKTLEEAASKLEFYHKKGHYYNFTQTKKFMVMIQKEILKRLK